MNVADYWANEPPEKFQDTFGEKVSRYYKQIKNGLWWQRVIRSVASYHNLNLSDQGQSIDLEVKQMGIEGEKVGLAANHVRNFIQHMLSMTTRDKIAINARSTNTDQKSIEQARIGRSLVEYYHREKQGEKLLRESAETALVYSAAYFRTDYDEVKRDIEMSIHTPEDVIYDLSVRHFEDSPWVAVKTYVSRWDLAARHPQFVQEILSCDEPEDQEIECYRGMMDEEEDERIPLWHFYHKKTDALPSGRCCLLIPGKYLSDKKFLYQEIPVRRISGGEWLMTALGWTMSFDLQALQEMYNAALSSFASAVNTFGLQDIWLPPGAEQIKSSLMEGGLRILSCAQKPEGIALLRVPGELIKFLDILNALMERLSGVNAVVRGDPEPSLKSGEALKVIESKAVQFASTFQASYNRLIEDTSTDMIRIIRDFAPAEARTINIVGKANQNEQRSFMPDELGVVDRVVVDIANPMSKSLSGKLAIVKDLMDMQLIRNKEQYFQILQTGNMDEILESDNAQLKVIRDENEMMARGELPPEPMSIDHIILHIREHTANLSNIESRMMGSPVRIVSEAHLAAHVRQFLDPNIQRIQEALGYQVPNAFIIPPTLPLPQPMPSGDGNNPGESPIIPMKGQAA